MYGWHSDFLCEMSPRCRKLLLLFSLNNLCTMIRVCVHSNMLSEHSCDVDSTSEGELRLPLPGPSDAASHLHPEVNSPAVMSVCYSLSCLNCSGPAYPAKATWLIDHPELSSSQPHIRCFPARDTHALSSSLYLFSLFCRRWHSGSP